MTQRARVGIGVCLLVLSWGVICPSLAQTEWTKHAGNPVLGPGAPGEWDDKTVGYPAVVLENGIYEMWYRGYAGSQTAICYATSPDGVTWTKRAGNPVMEGTGGEWDGGLGAIPSAAMRDGSTYKLWYWSAEGSGLRIGYATSTLPPFTEVAEYAGVDDDGVA